MKTIEDRAIIALNRTWDAIGYDALQTLVDCGEVKDIDHASMSREDVIDMVASCGFVGGYPMDHGDDHEAVTWLEAQPQKVQERILRKAFPHARYGM